VPMVAWETPDISENIARPVAMQVIRQLLQFANLPRSTPIRFPGTGGAVPVTGSTLDDKDAPDQLPTDPRLTIEVSEEYEEDNSGVQAILRTEQRHVFTDESLDVYIRPVYQRIQTTVEVKYNAPDKTSAQSWERLMKRRVAQGITEKFHVPEYHYPIPPEFMVILHEIHRLRELKGGDGTTFPQWLKRCFVSNMTVITNQAGNNPLFVIRESQSGVMGHTDFNIQPPRAERDGEAGNYVVSFTYTFNYDRVDSTVLIYPIVIHNTVIGKKYRPDIKPAELEDYYIRRSLSQTVLNEFTYMKRLGRAWEQVPGIPIPTYDEWVPMRPITTHQNVFRILIGIDEADPTALLNLTALGPWAFKPSAMAYMRDTPIYLAKPYESVFLLQLMRKQELLPSDQLMITQSMDVRTLTPMDVKVPYRLLIGMLVDLNLLSLRAKKKLCQYGAFAIELIRTIDPTATLPTLRLDGTISFDDFMAVLAVMSNSSYYLGNGQQAAWGRVGAFTLLSHRRT